MSKIKKAKIVVTYILGFAAILFCSYCAGGGLANMIIQIREKEES